MTLKLYRPKEDGLEPVSPGQEDWRAGLRSRRWKPAKLESLEGRETSPLMGVLFFVGLAALTFVLMVLGYATGFWG